MVGVNELVYRKQYSISLEFRKQKTKTMHKIHYIMTFLYVEVFKTYNIYIFIH